MLKEQNQKITLKYDCIAVCLAIISKAVLKGIFSCLGLDLKIWISIQSSSQSKRCKLWIYFTNWDLIWARSGLSAFKQFPLLWHKVSTIDHNGLNNIEQNRTQNKGTQQVHHLASQPPDIQYLLSVMLILMWCWKCKLMVVTSQPYYFEWNSPFLYDDDLRTFSSSLCLKGGCRWG